MQNKTVTTLAGDIPVSELGAYLCHKSIHAMPMSRGEYNTRRRWQLPPNEDASEHGYLVIYSLGTCKEYVSWSPAGVFEEGYVPQPALPAQSRREQPLSVSVNDGCLNISIGVELLAHAITMGPGGMGRVTVTDADVFAQSLVGGLLCEEEDGTTPVHRMLDKVAEQLAEDGDADGIRFDYE